MLREKPSMGCLQRRKGPAGVGAPSIKSPNIFSPDKRN